MAGPGRGNVYLYVPNLIGYARVIFAFVAFWFSYTEPVYFFVFYSLSQLLDAFDGMAARMLNQSSQFGAVLDMVTDRFSTNILLAVLAHLYTDYAIVFFFLMVLDIVSHWIHMYASLLSGSGSHKDMSSSNWFIRLYYKNRVVLFTVCACQEGVYLGLYLMHFWSQTPGSNLYRFGQAIFAVSVPLHLFKQGMNFLQLQMACGAINDWEAEKNAKPKAKGK